MKFKVGDVIKGKDTFYMITNKKMKKAKVKKIYGEYMDIEVIEHKDSFVNGQIYEVKNSPEYFELIEVAKEKFTKSDLKDGDIVTLRNGAKYTKCGRSLQNPFSFIGFLGLNLFDAKNLKFSASKDREMDIIKVERISHYETVFEREVEILDEAEKEYLKAVIKPFRNKIKYIQKAKIFMDNEAYIEIATKDDDTACLPSFDQDKMYRGMEVDKKYSLEELGL